MPEIKINGVTYSTPFANLFRVHTPIELRDMAESVREIWIHTPIIVYSSKRYGPAVIDGIGRATVALEVDSEREVPIDDYGEMTDEEAESLARHLNEIRRHLTTEELRKARAARIARIPELRAAGKSLWAIAKELGEDVATVHRKMVTHRKLKPSSIEPSTDVGLIDAPDSNVDFEEDNQEPEYVAEPARVTGINGRSYLATRAPVVTAVVTPDQRVRAALSLVARIQKHVDGIAEGFPDLLQGALKSKFRAAGKAWDAFVEEWAEAVKKAEAD